MNFLVKKYIGLGLIMGALATTPGTICASETPPIITKIQLAASQDGYTKAIQILEKEFEKNKDIKLELLILKAQLNFKNKKANEAIDIYKKLIEDYPENLLIYNNLAAIYASQGNLESAELTLLNGFNQLQDVDIAYRNLMKIKGKQASIAVQLALDPEKSNSKNLQLTTLNQVGSGIDISFLQQAPTANKLTVDTLSEKSKADVVINTSEPKALPPYSLNTQDKNDPKLESLRNNKDTPKIQEQTTREFKPTQNQSTKIDTEIPDLLNAWANEWSKGNSEGYLSFYSAQFTPEGDIGFQKWRAQRQQRITPNQEINVRLENIQIEGKNMNLIEASFKQIYTSRNLKARANKKVTLEKQNNQWKIIREEIIK